MSYHEVDPALRAAVETAVDQAISVGEFSRVRIVDQFASRHEVSRATLFRWVQRRAFEKTVSPITEKTLAADAAFVDQAAAPDSEADAARGKALALLPLGLEARGGAAVDLASVIAASIGELSAALALAKAADGTIKNPRLMLQIVNAIAQQVALAARIRPSVEHRAAQEQFMNDLVEAVIEEPPIIRDRVISRMQALRRRYSEQYGGRTRQSAFIPTGS